MDPEICNYSKVAVVNYPGRPAAIPGFLTPLALIKMRRFVWGCDKAAFRISGGKVWKSLVLSKEIIQATSSGQPNM